MELTSVGLGLLLGGALGYFLGQQRSQNRGETRALLTRALEREDQLQAELRRSRRDLQLLESFSLQLADLSVQDFQAVAEALLHSAASLLPTQTQALFRQRSCVAVHSPHRERATSASLALLTEPALETAQTQRLVSLECAPSDTRIFPDESHALAIRAGDFTLYLGRLGPPFRAHEGSAVGLILQLALSSLELSWQLKEQTQSHRHEQLQSRELKSRVDRLDRLLQAFHRLAGGREPSGEIENALQLCVTHRWGGLGNRSWPELMDLPEELRQTEQALLFEDFQASRFKAGAIGSLLVCPSQEGLLWVAAAEPAAFQEADLKLIQSFASFFSSMQENWRLQAQLVQSSKMAAVGQLAAGVAHEVNTPLGTVMVNVDGALKSATDEKQRRKLTRAKEEVRRAQQIVERLLYYSRVKADERHSVDPGELLRQGWALLEAQFRLDGVNVQMHLPDCPKVSCQPNEIQQVFHNLLLNARDAAPGQPIEVGLVPEKECVWVEVRDRGPGVNPEALPRLFEPFFTTKEVGKGTGLGLSVSRQIVERHGGRLEFQRCGDTTVFRFSLPLDTNS